MKTIERLVHKERLGVVERHYCEHCERERCFELHLDYAWSRYFRLVSCLQRENYAIRCTGCGRGRTIAPQRAREILKRDPVPFGRRFGLAAGAVALTLSMAMAIPALGMGRPALLAELAQPAVGDVYVVELSKFAPRLHAATSYGLVRVTQVTADSVRCVVARDGYTNPESAVQDLVSGRPARADYYAPNPYVVKRAHLTSMALARDIVRVERARRP